MLLLVCERVCHPRIVQQAAGTRYTKRGAISYLVFVFAVLSVATTVYQVCITPVLFTGVHNNQDQMWLAKIGKYIVFYVDLRS